jgi:DNA repair exonuclease SbcCD ATPase subunit
LVTNCLQSVFGEIYEFAINFTESRGKTDAKIVFKKDGMEVNPLKSCGGGVVDVAAFALRLAFVSTQPKIRRVIIADEPFRFVSQKYRQAVADMMVELSSKLDVQIIQITHIEEFQLGKVIRLP